MTLKEQLDAAEAKSNDLQTKLTAAEGEAKTAKANLETERSAHAETKTKLEKAEKDAKDAKASLETEKTAHAETKTKLGDAEEKDITASAKAAEQLAAAGINPAAKEKPGKLAASNDDPVAVWEKYQNADAVTQATMRDTLGDKLDAAAEAWDRAQAGK